MRIEKENNRRIFLIGFIGILLVYSLYYLLVRDSQQFYYLPRKLRHVFKFLSVMYVYGIGTWAFSKYKQAEWMLATWHIVHIVLIGFLLLLGVTDWLIMPLNFAWKHLGGSAHEFLISPALYMIAGIAHTCLQSNLKNTRN